MQERNETMKEYEDIRRNIRKMAEDEIKRIEERVDEIRKEAETIGEELESSLKNEGIANKKN